MAICGFQSLFNYSNSNSNSIFRLSYKNNPDCLSNTEIYLSPSNNSLTYNIIIEPKSTSHILNNILYVEPLKNNDYVNITILFSQIVM